MTVAFGAVVGRPVTFGAKEKESKKGIKELGLAEPKTRDEFWPIYLKAHSKPLTRGSHYAGTGTGVSLLALGVITGKLLLLPAAVVAGYGSAWFSHFVIEKNKPATFGHPLWSLMGDFKMAKLALTGQLKAELEKLGIEEAPKK